MFICIHWEDHNINNNGPKIEPWAGGHHTYRFAWISKLGWTVQIVDVQKNSFWSTEVPCHTPLQASIFLFLFKLIIHESSAAQTQGNFLKFYNRYQSNFTPYCLLTMVKQWLSVTVDIDNWSIFHDIYNGITQAHFNGVKPRSKRW